MQACPGKDYPKPSFVVVLGRFSFDFYVQIDVVHGFEYRIHLHLILDALSVLICIVSMLDSAYNPGLSNRDRVENISSIVDGSIRALRLLPLAMSSSNFLIKAV